MSTVTLAAIVAALLLGAWQLIARITTSRSALRTLAAKLSLSLGAALVCLLTLECVFRYFVVASDGFGFTLASKRWDRKYWHPVNSLGYRDLEPDPASLDGRRVLLVVGDSFVAGHGIRDYRDRFANLLGGLLGEDWRVRVVARRGWNTRQEKNGLRGYPLAPDVVVLSYYVNDIEDAATAAGLPRPGLVRPPPPLLRPLVDHLYSANFVYWRLVRFRTAAAIGEIHRRHLDEAYHDEATWRIHRRELIDLVRVARRRSKRLFVVVFPNLIDVDSGRALTSRVARLMRARGVEVLDLTSRLAGRDTDSMIVSRLDGHPNVALHREVATLLNSRLTSEGRTAAP